MLILNFQMYDWLFFFLDKTDQEEQQSSFRNTTFNVGGAT